VLIYIPYHQTISIHSDGGIPVKKIGVLLASALLFLALAAVASAHAQITSCTPAIGGTVATAPDKVTCQASEAMDPKGSSLAVFDAMGMQVDMKDSAVDLNDPDRVTIAVSLDKSKIVDGVYTVKWNTLSSADGDAADGEFQFAVGANPVTISPTATPAPEGAGATPLPAGTIKIVSPENNATVPVGKLEIKIALTGVTLGDSYHWHVYLDNNMMTMVTNASDTATIDVPAGEHDIKVALADAAHDDLANDTVHVTVQGAAPSAQGSPTAEPTMAMEMGTATAEPTMMMENTATPQAEATAAPTTAPTAAPSTLPTSGNDANLSLYGLIALAGMLVLGIGVFAAARARR
jgi:methionine-rich copper-binding protein CopC